MTEKIKSYIKRNMYVFYGSQILNGLRFIGPVWVLFFTHYVTFQQLAFLEAFGLLISVFLELPTGALADIIGRKNTIIFGYLLSGFGYVVIGFGHSFDTFLLGYTIGSFGAAFASGADTAILFDTLKEHDLQDDYARYSGRTVFLFRLAVTIGMVAGQYLYAITIGLPYVACGLAIMASGLMYIFVHEPSRERQNLTVNNYFHGIEHGFKEAFKDRATTLLSLYFITIAAVELILLWFYYAPYISWLGYTAANIGLIYGAIAAARLVVTLLSHRLDKVLGDAKVLYLLPLVLGIALLFGSVWQRAEYLHRIIVSICALRVFHAALYSAR